MERYRRIVLWAMMLVLAFLLFLKSRAPSGNGDGAAFLREDARRITIRIAGNIVNPGVYVYQRGIRVGTVMKMTIPEWRPDAADNDIPNRALRNGDILELNRNNKQHIEITMKRMQAREMMILGIPMDPNALEVGDWECLPGIGPALALRIVKDRQENGDFSSVKDLERVPGIGKVKIKQLAKYF